MNSKANNFLHYVVIAGLFLVPFTPLIVSSSLFFPFITGKAFIFRLIVEVTLAAWLILILIDKQYRPSRSGILWSAVAWLGVTILATTFSVNPYHSFWSNFERMEGLVTYLHLFAYFLVLGSFLTTEKLWQRWWATSVGVSILICLYSLLQLFGKISIDQSDFRLDATLGNATYLAAYLLVHIFITIYLWQQTRRGSWWRYLAVAAMILQAVVLYFTATRGAILGLIGGLFIAALIYVWRGRDNLKLRRWALGLIIAVVVLAGGFWLIRQQPFIQNNPVLTRLANISVTETTTQARLLIWQMSLRGFKEHPVLGWGPDNYLLVFNKYYDPQMWPQEQWFDRSHNIFLDWMVSAGLLGLLSYLALFAFAFYYLWRSRITFLEKCLFTGLLVAYGFQNIFVFDNLTSYLLFFALLGHLHFQATNQGEKAAQSQPREVALTGNQLLLTILVVAGLAGSLYYIEYKPWRAGHQLALAAARLGDGASPAQVQTFWENKSDYFNQIFSGGTFAASEASEQLALSAGTIRLTNVPTDLKQKFYDEAVKEIKFQIESDPLNARRYLFLGSLLNNSGQSKQAIPYLEKALSLSPRKQTLAFGLVSAYYTSGDVARALDLAKQIYQWDESYPEAAKVYALLMFKTGQTKAAEQFIKDKNLELDERFVNVYVELNNYSMVLKIWQAAVRNNPKNIQYRLSLAAAYLTVGDRAQSIAQLQKISELKPEAKTQIDFYINEIKAGRNPVR